MADQDQPAQGRSGSYPEPPVWYTRPALGGNDMTGSTGGVQSFASNREENLAEANFASKNLGEIESNLSPEPGDTPVA